MTALRRARALRTSCIALHAHRPRYSATGIPAGIRSVNDVAAPVEDERGKSYVRDAFMDIHVGAGGGENPAVARPLIIYLHGHIVDQWSLSPHFSRTHRALPRTHGRRWLRALRLHCRAQAWLRGIPPCSGRTDALPESWCVLRPRHAEDHHTRRAQLRAQELIHDRQTLL